MSLPSRAPHKLCRRIGEGAELSETQSASLLAGDFPSHSNTVAHDTHPSERRSHRQRRHITFAMAAGQVAAMAEDFDPELPPRKKPKISELPLSSAQRSSIDGMLHTFKKKGEFGHSSGKN